MLSLLRHVVLWLPVWAQEPDAAALLDQTSHYMHVAYDYQLHRASMPRSGEGDLWISWEAQPVVRLRGVATSPKFGRGVITLVLDAGKKAMYARIELENLHMDQCLMYPFPDGTAEVDRARLATLKRRHDEFGTWEHEEEHDYHTGKTTHLLPWTARYRMGFVTHNSSERMMGVMLRDGKRVVKKVEFQRPPEHSLHVPEAERGMFQPPSSKCQLPEEFVHDMGQVDLRPPHQRSSALNDLLLIMSSDDPIKEWSQEFFLVACMLLPGDVAIMLEDPEPPNIERLHHIAFDYSAVSTAAGGNVSRSQGAIWIDMENRAFRLNGNAKNTKVGDLHIDILVHANSANPQIYANVKLVDEDEHQCLQYEYPDLTGHPKEDLEDSSKRPLRFYSISEIDGEDCAVFTAPLARNRWLHVWVDMESQIPDAFLRTEIHHEGHVLRSTKVLQWRTGEDVAVQVQPKAEWHCSEAELGGRLARLDIRTMHHKSIQLEDSLFALHELSPDFAVREILGLTGDVAIVVKVPSPPDMGLLRRATLDYVMHLDSSMSRGPVNGNFAVDVNNRLVRLSAKDVDNARVTVAVNMGEALAVQIERPGQASRCLQMDLKAVPVSTLGALSAGIFQAVEALDGQECNHFKFPGTQTLDLWYSEEDKAICQIDLMSSSPSQLTRLDVLTFIRAYLPEVDVFAQFQGPPDTWRCPALAEGAWLSTGGHLAEQEATEDASAAAVGRVAQLLGMVGLLPSQAAAAITTLSISGNSGSSATRTSHSGLVLVRRPATSAPRCCATEGLQAKGMGKASPLVRDVAGTRYCYGDQVKSEQEWVDDFAAQLAGAQDVLGVCLKDGYYEQQIPQSNAPMNDDVMSPLLKSFGFSFRSSHPLEGFPEGLRGGQKFTGEAWRPPQVGSGELRVDLPRRRLYVRSSSKFSTGIPHVKSEIIYRGDLHKLYARTVLSGQGPDYVQCYVIDTAQALPATGPAKNPFTRGQLSGQAAPVPEQEGRMAQKYTFFLDPEKRLDFFVDGQRQLAYLKLKDLMRDVSTGVRTDSWVSAISEEVFEIADTWKCEQRLPEAYLNQLSSWDLIKVFLPA
ncbi:unnamed protein product [Effrenium voratum]|nr:unnamed protein product [Effrenium voratum]